MSPIIPSRYGHPKYNIFPQKTRSTASSGFKTVQRGTPGGGGDSKSRRKQRIEESKITVQPTEDDDGDNFYSKHLAAARFQRNHRLINVLFSDVVVDQEQGLDAERLQACKKRIQGLTEYQKKIDGEIVELNEKFNAKKAKIMEDGKKFAEKLSECVTTSKKELEVLRAAQEVRRQQAKAEAAVAAATAAESNKSSETKEKNSTQALGGENSTNDKETPMEVSLVEAGDSILKDEVRQVLENLCASVANAIQLLAT